MRLYGKPNYPIIASDTLYQKLNAQILSSFHLFQNGKEVYNCLLKEIPIHIKEIQRIIALSKDSIDLRSVKLPKNFKWKVTPKNIYLCDRNFYNITVIPIAEPENNRKIRNSAQLSELNYQKNLDSNEITEIKDLLRALKLPVAGRIEDFYTDEDTLYFTIYNYYPITGKRRGIAINLPEINETDTIIMGVFSLVKYIDGKVISISPIKYKLPYEENGYTFSQNSFFVRNQIPYFSLTNRDKTLMKDYKFLSEWKNEKDSLKFKRFLNFGMPEIHKSNEDMGYHFSVFEYQHPYLVNVIGNELYNVETEDVKKLPLNNKISDFSDIKAYRFKLNFVISDFSHRNDTVRIIAREFDKFYLYNINIKTQKLIKKKQQLLSEYDIMDLLGGIKFLNFDTICFIDRNNSTLYFRKL